MTVRVGVIEFDGGSSVELKSTVDDFRVQESNARVNVERGTAQNNRCRRCSSFTFNTQPLRCSEVPGAHARGSREVGYVNEERVSVGEARRQVDAERQAQIQ